MTSLLEVRDLHYSFASSTKALEAVTFTLLEGETVGVVGESGSGKSTLAKLITQLLPCPPKTVFFEGNDLSLLSSSEQRRKRKNLQIVLQDSYSSLNPKMTVQESLEEPFLIHRLPLLKETAEELLSLVELSPSYLRRFPSELSGGQRQKVCLARALALQPKLLICDEILASLDRISGAEILRLLTRLQRTLSLSLLFIAHDLRAVQYISSRILVLHQGRCIEEGETTKIYTFPEHPYTKALLSTLIETRKDLDVFSC